MDVIPLNNSQENQQSTSKRKQEHLDLCRQEAVESELAAGWDQVQLPHIALPEKDIADITLTTRFLNYELNAPLMISSMTGGSSEGEFINERLATLAERHKIAMGVGSQRVALENREKKYFSLRKKAPKALLFANIGAVQLNYGVTIEDCQWLVDELQANAFILHANVLQECIQEEGNRNFSGLIKKIESLCKKLSVPVILKETGCGLDTRTVTLAYEAGVRAFDIAGMGGTHWGFIEGLRHPKRRQLGEIFRNWGIPSQKALVLIKEALPKDTSIIASGGIRSGLDVARALYLGANLAGMALPFLKAAGQSEEALEEFYQLQIEALRIALFCSGENLK